MKDLQLKSEEYSERKRASMIKLLCENSFSIVMQTEKALIA